MAGDFCDIDDWHPAIADCVLKVEDGALHRILTTVEGGEFVEKRIAFEARQSYTHHRKLAAADQKLHGDVFY